MTYTPKQQEYIDSIDGAAHQSAVEIIGELEKRLAELTRPGKCTCKAGPGICGFYCSGQCTHEGAGK
jgi:hypothetical protein